MLAGSWRSCRITADDAHRKRQEQISSDERQSCSRPIGVPRMEGTAFCGIKHVTLGEGDHRLDCRSLRSYYSNYLARPFMRRSGFFFFRLSNRACLKSAKLEEVSNCMRLFSHSLLSATTVEPAEPVALQDTWPQFRASFVASL